MKVKHVKQDQNKLIIFLSQTAFSYDAPLNISQALTMSNYPQIKTLHGNKKFRTLPLVLNNEILIHEICYKSHPRRY